MAEFAVHIKQADHNQQVALALLQQRLGSAPKAARELDQAVAELKKLGYSAEDVMADTVRRVDYFT